MGGKKEMQKAGAKGDGRPPGWSPMTWGKEKGHTTPKGEREGRIRPVPLQTYPPSTAAAVTAARAEKKKGWETKMGPHRKKSATWEKTKREEISLLERVKRAGPSKEKN